MALGILRGLQYRTTTKAELVEARSAMRKLVANDAFWNRLADYCGLMAQADLIRQKIDGRKKRRAFRRRVRTNG